MRAQLDPSAPVASATTAPTSVDEVLVELGLVAPDATPQQQREAIRVFQQARHLPETGVMDAATRLEAQDALRMRQAMLRNAAAAGEGGPVGDSASTIASAESLAMARFASQTSTPRAVTQTRTARALGRNLARRSTSELLTRAARLQHTLDETPRTPRNTSLRRATLTSLMALYDEVDRRVTNAPPNADGLPELGIQWDECSPLAGTTMDLHPFGNRDQWAAELATLPRVVRQAREAIAETPTPTPNPIPTGVPIDARDALEVLQPPRESVFGGWEGAAATPAFRVIAALTNDIVGPIGSAIVNAGQLARAWRVNAQNNEAAGRALGAEVALEVATMSTDAMRSAIRDGEITPRELRRIVHGSTSGDTRWNQQLRYATTAADAAERSMNEGVALAADILNQALSAMRDRLDQEGVDDPSARRELLLRAVNQAATAGLRAIAERNQEIRTSITGR